MEQTKRQPHRVSLNEFELLVRFVDGQILTGVDGGLKRAVESLLKENQDLREQFLLEGVKKAAAEWWDKWEDYDPPLKLSERTKKRLRHRESAETIPLDWLQAKFSTTDGRITKGLTYQGFFVRTLTKAASGTYWRVCVVRDNKSDRMTFDPDIFKPADIE